jgi:hypothetical protein
MRDNSASAPGKGTEDLAVAHSLARQIVEKLHAMGIVDLLLSSRSAAGGSWEMMGGGMAEPQLRSPFGQELEE